MPTAKVKFSVIKWGSTRFPARYQFVWMLGESVAAFAVFLVAW
jgi:hypothetical protein